MVVDSFIKSQMHRMPTYDEVIYDTVINPTARINLPDRRATQLRNTHQLTRFDEVDQTIDLAEEQEKITKHKLREVALQGMGVGPDETATLVRAIGTQTGNYGARPEQATRGIPPPPGGSGSSGEQPTREKLPIPPPPNRGWIGRIGDRLREKPKDIPYRDPDPFGWGKAALDERNKRWDDEQELRDEEERAALKAVRARKSNEASQVAIDLPWSKPT